MASSGHRSALEPSTDAAAIVRVVTIIMGTVVGLTFMFGFGNVLNLAIRLGVPVWVAPLVAPAVDLSILGLLLGTRHLALSGVSPDVLRPARRLLIFASAVTLALNVADPVIAGEYGKAAFDAVGPLLLIGWAEVGPGFLQAIGATRSLEHVRDAAGVDESGVTTREVLEDDDPANREQVRLRSRKPSQEMLLEEARQEDAAHRARHQRPISAETLRVRLGIGAASARQLVKIVRMEFERQVKGDVVGGERAREIPSGEAARVA